jgi:hypothetical protein
VICHQCRNGECMLCRNEYTLIQKVSELPTDVQDRADAIDKLPDGWTTDSYGDILSKRAESATSWCDCQHKTDKPGSKLIPEQPCGKVSRQDVHVAHDWGGETGALRYCPGLRAPFDTTGIKVVELPD